MEEAFGRKELVRVGKELLEKQLVARTWGNCSCRLDDDSFLITPSGLDYTRTTEDDIVRYRMSDGSWEGRRKPSSEKKIHAAAYSIFPEENFVIHTHQTFATALGLAGWDSMDITDEELAFLGGIGRAEYGLPGQKSLSSNVEKILKTGARVVLMAHHGALIIGKDREEALKKAELLENICRRNCRGVVPGEKSPDADAGILLKEVRREFPGAAVCSTDALLQAADMGRPIPAQLDDMAQMIGGRIPVTDRDVHHICDKLKSCGAVLVPGLGALVSGKDADDTEALGILADKSAVSRLHTAACGADGRLPWADVALMHMVYKFKYSKQKEGKADE